MDYKKIEDAISIILRQMHNDLWKPKRVVGFDDDGIVPALYIANHLNAEFQSIQTGESNCWMSEYALGYTESSEPENILVVCGVNDHSQSFDWLMSDWKSSCLPNDSRWFDVWGNTTRFAALVDTNHAKRYADIDYSGAYYEDDDKNFITFPWHGLTVEKIN